VEWEYGGIRMGGVGESRSWERRKPKGEELGY